MDEEDVDWRYHFELIDNSSRLDSLKQNWRNLLNVSSFDSFYSTPEWIISWWQSFSKPTDFLRVVTVYSQDELIVVAPLMITTVEEYGFSMRVLKFIGSPNADRSDVIVKAGEEAIFPSLMKFFLAKIPGWSQFHLIEFPSESLFGRWLWKNYPNVYREYGSECPYIPLSEWTSWEEYFGSLSKNFRKSIRKKRNKLQRERESSFRCIERVTAKTVGLIRAQQLEGNSEKAGRISNLVLADMKSFSFQKKLMDVQGSTYQVLLFVLEIDKEIAAYRYGYLYKNKYYSYNTSFSSQAAMYSPGMLTLCGVIQYCLENSVGEYDFLRGAMQHKSHWTRHSRLQCNIYFLKNTMMNKVYSKLVFKIRPFLKENILPFLQRIKKIRY